MGDRILAALELHRLFQIDRGKTASAARGRVELNCLFQIDGSVIFLKSSFFIRSFFYTFVFYNFIFYTFIYIHYFFYTFIFIRFIFYNSKFIFSNKFNIITLQLLLTFSTQKYSSEPETQKCTNEVYKYCKLYSKCILKKKDKGIFPVLSLGNVNRKSVARFFETKNFELKKKNRIKCYCLCFMSVATMLKRYF